MISETTQPATIQPAVPQSRTQPNSRPGSSRLRIANELHILYEGPISDQNTKNKSEQPARLAHHPRRQHHQQNPSPRRKSAPGSFSVDINRSTNWPAPSGTAIEPIASVAKIEAPPSARNSQVRQMNRQQRPE